MSRRLSDSSDDSSASDNSHEQPPSFNCDGNQEENIQWKHKALYDELKIKIKELNSCFDKNHPALTAQIKGLQNTIDELESTHKKIVVGSLTGASLGVAGGITSIAGLCLAPFTFGASLALVGVGTAVGVAGGATSATCAITNRIIPKNLCETIEKIIKDVQNTIKSMIEQLNEIYDNIEDIEQLEETMRQEGVTTDVSELTNKNGNILSQFVKDMLGWAGIDGSALTVGAAKVFFMAAQAAHVSGDAAKVAHRAVSVSGILSVVSIAQYSTELSEINQSADNRNKENIKSDTVKFIHQVRQKAAAFQKTLGNIECLRKTLDQEFNKMLQSSTSSQAKSRGTVINNDNLFFNTL